MKHCPIIQAFFAAAVAAQLPALTPAQASPLVDELCKVSLNGLPPLSVSIKPAADNWYCVIAEFTAVEPVFLDFALIAQGGLFICRPGDDKPKHPLYASAYIAHLEQRGDGCTLAVYVKPLEKR